MFSFECGSCGGFETDGLDEEIKIVDDALVKTVEWRSPFGFEPSVWFDRSEKACRERGIDPFEQLEKDKAESRSDRSLPG